MRRLKRRKVINHKDLLSHRPRKRRRKNIKNENLMHLKYVHILTDVINASESKNDTLNIDWVEYNKRNETHMKSYKKAQESITTVAIGESMFEISRGGTVLEMSNKSIPLEIVLKITHYLNPLDIKSLKHTCRVLYRTITWRIIVSRFVTYNLEIPEFYKHDEKYFYNFYKKECTCPPELLSYIDGLNKLISTAKIEPIEYTPFSGGLCIDQIMTEPPNPYYFFKRKRKSFWVMSNSIANAFESNGELYRGAKIFYKGDIYPFLGNLSGLVGRNPSGNIFDLKNRFEYVDLCGIGFTNHPTCLEYYDSDEEKRIVEELTDFIVCNDIDVDDDYEFLPDPTIYNSVE